MVSKPLKVNTIPLAIVLALFVVIVVPATSTPVIIVPLFTPFVALVTIPKPIVKGVAPIALSIIVLELSTLPFVVPVVTSAAVSALAFKTSIG